MGIAMREPATYNQWASSMSGSFSQPSVQHICINALNNEAEEEE